MHRCYAPDAALALTISGHATVLLDDKEAHHVVHVLRLNAGDPVILFDGCGHEWDARMTASGRGGALVERLASRTAVVEPPVAVTLAIGLLKGDAMNTVVRDATALGVARIVPTLCAHGAVPARASRDEAVARWTRVAVASAKQCARAVVPSIGAVTPFRDVIAECSGGVIVVCVEPRHTDGAPVRDLPKPDRALLCVGPEGGWSADEVAMARNAGARLLDLGPRVLRAETAPTVALSALWTHWGWR